MNQPTDDSTATSSAGFHDRTPRRNAARSAGFTSEKARVSMNERYRTLLGHFRHEVGHYYWERLVRERERHAPFRALFGDETEDYGEALKRHYDAGPPAGWDQTHISAYATMHPWEDWAETFAHYLHMVDTLETAQHYGFTSQLPARTRVQDITNFDLLMEEWTELTIALNALNHSMGLPDAYPFAISPRVREKLEFIGGLIHEERSRGASRG